MRDTPVWEPDWHIFPDETFEADRGSLRATGREPNET